MIILTANKNTAITALYASIRDGEPIAYPTDTIYGIGAPLASIEANEKIYTIKKRNRTNPLPVLIGSWEQFNELALPLSTDRLQWLEELWSGDKPYTVVVKARPTVPILYTKGGTIALRMVKTKWLADAISVVGAVTATSVNISGSAPLNDPESIKDRFNVKYMLWGDVSNETPSTIVDISQEQNQILRDS
ncbi:MAG: L-threonylcarbamoyladenylate synthase [Deferribacteraceae bacterium]|jgi:L-threonylcarbamoyladenylate synthase|nr:L-threonylcarbamoyladenylate synthase [Deferribacteraceae bacterium]